ncbi:MAG TPA: hypothetical protein DDW90_08595 [Cyanobacteria bacterium UBA9971]|nr:hypothetical protein [Cyanobacteria bacterium UBA9971]
MFSQIEKVLAKYPTIIQAFAATSTLAAVITSLWVARNANTPKIKLNLSISMPIDDYEIYNINKDKSYISVDITNIGNIPVYLKPYCIYWSATPFAQLHGIIKTITPIPDKIEPGTNSSIMLSELEYTSKHLKEFLGKNFINLKIKFLRLNVKLQNGAIFQVKVSKNIVLRNR